VERKGGTDFGSVFGLLNIAFSLGLMVGPLLGSALTDRLGLKPAMGLLAVGFVLYLGLFSGRCRSWVVASK
jgi:MFS family permease